MDNDFLREADEGLSHYPKKLSSKFFYDQEGDKLFQQIMNLPEYYLTRAELNIFQNQSDAIIKRMSLTPELHLYELGAGDGVKSIILLQALLAQQFHVHYHPIDISQNALGLLRSNIAKAGLAIGFAPINKSYFDALELIDEKTKENNLFVFMGSNLGNLPHPLAIDFLTKIGDKMKPNDYLLMGVDKMKNPSQILAAYNDSQGVTRDFNLNILRRINTELGGNFTLENFRHFPVYNPETGTTKSYLVSQIKQEIFVKKLNKTFAFEQWETIHTEISQKYNLNILNWICDASGLKLLEAFTDANEYFLECLIVRNPL